MTRIDWLTSCSNARQHSGGKAEAASRTPERRA
jgi:hypothetical protein